jgi:hypothetical protein
VSTSSFDPSALPRVSEHAQFVSEVEAVGRPHAVVDGPMLPGTKLCLSHWPATATPEALLADTSAAIVDRYIDLEPGGPDLALVTNNHFDEDGLFAAWLLLERPPPGPLRDLALAAAEAGDFHTWTDPAAPRCALAVRAMADRATTPFPQVKRALARPDNDDATAVMYRTILRRVPSLLADPDRYAFLWADAWGDAEADIASLESGESTIREVPDLDLAVVRAPRPLAEFAVYPLTARMRVLTRTDSGHITLRYRYETWIRYISRPLPPRVDLAPVLEELQSRESRPGTWRFEGVDPATPRLYFGDDRGMPAPSGLELDEVVEILRPRLELRI